MIDNNINVTSVTDDYVPLATMFFPEQLLRAKSQQVHTLPLSVLTVWSRKRLDRTFICFKVVLQKLNCVFYTVKMEHSRHSCHPHIGIN